MSAPFTLSDAGQNLSDSQVMAAIRADLAALSSDRPDQIRSVDQIGNSDVVGASDDARARHLRRQLAQAAEHGAALLASLSLPRLVGPDFVPLDPVAIGDALESTIAALDAIDGDPEAEPWLGWTTAGAIGAAHDAEHDTADAELDLGWPANHSQLHLGDNTLDGDLSALERHGRGFVRSGPDDAEDSDPPERDDEHGSEDAEDIGHHASRHVPRPLGAADRAAGAAMTARALQARRAAHV